MIENIIAEFAEKYRWHYESQKDTCPTPEQGINSGLCDLFCDEIKNHFPQAKCHYDEEHDHYSEIDGLFYDAENPKGKESRSGMIFLGIM